MHDNNACFVIIIHSTVFQYAMCKQAADKIAAVHNTRYEIGTAYETVGKFTL